jgi:hypothetical protein
MSIKDTPTISQFPVWATDEGCSPVQRYSPMVTPSNIRDRALFGIPLVSAFNQQELNDDAIQEYINQAVSEVEHILDLYITPVTFQEKHDYNKEFFAWSFAYLKLNHPNVIRVHKVAISFNNSFDANVAVDFPREFVHVQPQEGVIQLVPATGTSLGGFILSIFFGVQFHALRLANILDYPGAIRVTYDSGFEEDKVPSLLVGLIETIAALKILSIIGPILFPHNSVSIGIDGVSQSTSNLGPNFFRARIQDLEKQRETQLEAAKGYYQRQFLIDTI